MKKKTLKVYRRLSTAEAHANGLPIIEIEGGLYIVGFEDLLDAQLTEIRLIAGDGGYAGCITLNHLNRLGNANHALANDEWRMDNCNAFPKEGE